MVLETRRAPSKKRLRVRCPNDSDQPPRITKCAFVRPSRFTSRSTLVCVLNFTIHHDDFYDDGSRLAPGTPCFLQLPGSCLTEDERVSPVHMKNLLLLLWQDRFHVTRRAARVNTRIRFCCENGVISTSFYFVRGSSPSDAQSDPQIPKNVLPKVTVFAPVFAPLVWCEQCSQPCPHHDGHIIFHEHVSYLNSKKRSIMFKQVRVQGV